MLSRPIDEIDIIAPNLKRRLSGVTSTVARLVPLQAHSVAIAAVGYGLPSTVPRLPVRSVLTMSRSGPRGIRVWHARRNSEMLAGLALRHLLRKKLKLVFTSASQRTHTAYTKWLIGQMDAVVATSQKSANYLAHEARVILHGIDIHRYRPPASKATVRKRLGLPDGQLIGCYGRIRAQKGTGDFVEALIRVLAEFPDAYGIVMGRATERHQDYWRGIREHILANDMADRILLKPEVPEQDMAIWYQALDLYVAPQRWEGFGLTPLEAMACGVPVLATRVGAFEELIVDGATGRLIAPRDVGAMASQIREYLANPSERGSQGEAARSHVEAHFPLEREAKALNAIYEELLREAEASGA